MLLDYLYTQRRWSVATFGVGRKTKAITNHIRKELAEIEATPDDLEEWIDVAILALDGAWRTGSTPEEIIVALERKQAINRQRQWVIPEDEDAPIEHDRTGEIDE